MGKRIFRSYMGNCRINLDNTIVPIISDVKEVWAYDFDGVIHKLMNPGEDFTTSHRNPDHIKLSSNFEKLIFNTIFL